MTKEVIETGKGRFLVVDSTTLDKVSGQALVDEYGDYIILSETTEEQANNIIDEPFGLGVGDNKVLVFKDYEDEENAYLSSIDSLHSLLKSKGIKITNNTYIFKL